MICLGGNWTVFYAFEVATGVVVLQSVAHQQIGNQRFVSFFFFLFLFVYIII